MDPSVTQFPPHPPPPRRAGIALGSNLGDREAAIRAAIAALRAIHCGGHPFLEARLLETEPDQCPPGSPPFLNTVVELSFAGGPHELLGHAREIEARLGRRRSGQTNEPRVIDIDILYLGGETVAEPDLTLPHPRIARRRFVLEPLAAIRPDLILPGQSQTVLALLGTLDNPPG